MRYRNSIALMAGLTLLLGAAPEARALAIVDIIWTATTGGGTTGGSTIFGGVGNVHEATIFLTPDAGGTKGISSYSISLEFDTDLVDELKLISATELLPAGFTFNITTGVASSTDSSGAAKGDVLSYEAATFGLGPTAATAFAIGTVEFQTTANVATDGLDVFSGLFNVGIDGLFDNAGLPETATFNSASVNIPEPATSLLLAAGLAALAARRRRAHRA